MSLFRLILWGLILYLGFRFFRSFFQGQPREKQEVHGKSKNKPLDLNKEDIEDVDFKDLDDDKK